MTRYLVKSNRTGNYVSGEHRGNLTFAHTQRKALRLSRIAAASLVDVNDRGWLKVVKLVPTRPATAGPITRAFTQGAVRDAKTHLATAVPSTPLPVASSQQPPQRVQTLLVRRSGRDFIGASIADELNNRGILASRIIAIVPVLTRPFGGVEHETTVVSIIYTE